MDFAGIEQFIDTPVKRYSSGMYVRLAFAVAAHLEPEILIVDEVLAVGDAEFQKKCLGKMGDVAHEGRTVLFVSHNMAMVENLCPRSLLLKQTGRTASDDSTGRVLQQYLYTIATTSASDLESRTDRKGTQQVRFSAVEYLDEHLETVQNASSGQMIIIRLHYKSFLPANLKRVPCKYCR